MNEKYQDVMNINITTLDVETTFQIDGKKFDPSPFHPKNRLVSVGYKRVKFTKDANIVFNDYICFWHNHQTTRRRAANIIQTVLDSTELLVGHNLKFDLEWLAENEFIYNGLIYDTMLAEYVMAQAERMPFNLADCCKRHGLEEKKTNLIKTYLDQGIGFEEMPWSIVEEYGRADVDITYQLFLKQLEILQIDIWEYFKRATVNTNNSYDEQDVPSFSKGRAGRM